MPYSVHIIQHIGVEITEEEVDEYRKIHTSKGRTTKDIVEELAWEKTNSQPGLFFTEYENYQQYDAPVKVKVKPKKGRGSY